MAQKKQNDGPAAVEERLLRIEEAWRTLAPDAIFGKMTLAQFQARIKPSLERRAALQAAKDVVKNLETQRDHDDIESVKAAEEVVKGVVGDPDFGDDCGLYGAMGYKLKSQYKSGLTRKSAASKAGL